MHRFRARGALLVLAHLIVLSALSSGQSSARTASGIADQTFSEIQSSLAQAADAALTSDSASEQAVDMSTARSRSFIKTDGSTSALGRPPGVDRIESMEPLIQPILAREGVPVELSAVIQIESAGNPFALSSKGARGLWQLMPATARRYGLHVDSYDDERTDIEKSTTVAARYLHHLYVQFGSWPLALAAYNTGDLNLRRAIDRAGSNEFTALSFLGYLPIETRNYVPAVLAAMDKSHKLAEIANATAKPKTFVYAVSAPGDSQLREDRRNLPLP